MLPLCFLLACDDKVATSAPVVGRGDAVLAKSGETAPATTAPRSGIRADPDASASAAKPKRAELCSAKPMTTLPAAKLQSFGLGDHAALDPELPVGVGKWVWVNFWAAWCGPCKEEMPLLLEWQKKLAAQGTRVELAFVSIDEDERQLKRFLEKQPDDGVKASYWLPEGKPRTELFESIAKEDTPELPLHALVAPSGKVECLIDGAVEESDYPALAKLFGGKN